MRIYKYKLHNHYAKISFIFQFYKQNTSAKFAHIKDCCNSIQTTKSYKKTAEFPIQGRQPSPRTEETRKQRAAQSCKKDYNFEIKY